MMMRRRRRLWFVVGVCPMHEHQPNQQQHKALARSSVMKSSYEYAESGVEYTHTHTDSGKSRGHECRPIYIIYSMNDDGR